jgi:hypothetical protein
MTAIVMQLVVSATPSMAEGTASVKPASGAEKAPTARPEALQPGAYGGEGQDIEVVCRQDPREGRVGECQHRTLTATSTTLTALTIIDAPTLYIVDSSSPPSLARLPVSSQLIDECI